MDKRMIKYLLSYLFVIISVSSVHSEDYLKLESIDEVQESQKEIGVIKIYKSTRMDTTLLNNFINNKEFIKSKFEECLIKTNDSNNIVFIIYQKENPLKKEYFKTLIFEFKNKKPKNLYLIEQAYFADFWKLVESSISFRILSNHTIKIDAILSILNFDTSGSINFPYNDNGLYDYNIDRYLKLECEFNISDSLIYLFK